MAENVTHYPATVEMAMAELPRWLTLLLNKMWSSGYKYSKTVEMLITSFSPPGKISLLQEALSQSKWG